MKRNINFICFIIVICLLTTSFTFLPKVKAANYQVSGYLDVEIAASRFVVEQNESETDKDTAYPTRYSLPELGYDTSVKNQNPYGTCWTFGTMASSESSLLKTNKDTAIDLSELQLAYFLYNRNDDPLHLTTNDQNILIDSAGNPKPLSELLNNGGNTYIACVGIAGGLGYINENLLPYSKAKDVSLGNIPDASLAYENNSYLLKEAYWITMSETRTIKEILMNYGAIAVSIYYDDKYYNADNAAYFCHDLLLGTNHAVTIVGWDDDYSRKNFGSFLNGRPLIDGAWLVKNSWGDDWGDEGYFWVSYFDYCIGDVGVKFIIEPVEEDYDIYQYDGTSCIETINKASKSATSANIYTAQSDCYLDEVGYFTQNTNVNYKIDIYTNLTDATNPLSGTLALSTSGADVFAGYHTVDLAEYVFLEKDSKFSIVLTQSVSSGSVYVSVDCDTSYSWIKFVNDSKENESFFSFNDEELSCLTYENNDGETKYYTARIKGYTIDIPTFEYSKADKTTLVKYNGELSGEIELPNKTKAIGDNVFVGEEGITSIICNEGLESIGKNFCKDCANLTSITLSNTIMSIDSTAFENVKLTSLILPDTLKTIDTEYLEAKCAEDGHTMGYHCSLCENLIIESERINKLNHDFNNYISNEDASFESDGSKTSKCSRCEEYSTISDEGSKKVAKSIVIKNKDYIDYYHLGADLPYQNTVLTITDDEGYSEEVTVNESMISGFDSITAGQKDITYTCFNVSVHDYVMVVEYDLGDVNADMAINDADAIRVLMNIFYPNDYPINQKIDFNLDGEYNDADAVYLLMYSFFPNEYPIYDWWIKK